MLGPKTKLIRVNGIQDNNIWTMGELEWILHIGMSVRYNYDFP